MRKKLNILSAGKNLEILELLKNGKKSVGEIHQALEMPQNLCSHHLGRLRSMGVVKVEKEGTFRWYSRDEKAIKALKAEMRNI